jgi:hypothetical protein
MKMPLNYANLSRASVASAPNRCVFGIIKGDHFRGKRLLLSRENVRFVDVL